MCVGTLSGVTSAGMVISSARRGTWTMMNNNSDAQIPEQLVLDRARCCIVCVWIATYRSDAQWICRASHKVKKCYVKRLWFRQSCLLTNGNVRLYNITVCMWMIQQNFLDVQYLHSLGLNQVIHDASGSFIKYMSWSGDAYLIRKLLTDQGHNQRGLPYLGCTDTWT